MLVDQGRNSSQNPHISTGSKAQTRDFGRSEESGITSEVSIERTDKGMMKQIQALIYLT